MSYLQNKLLLYLCSTTAHIWHQCFVNCKALHINPFELVNYAQEPLVKSVNVCQWISQSIICQTKSGAFFKETLYILSDMFSYFKAIYLL